MIWYAVLFHALKRRRYWPMVQEIWNSLLTPPTWSPSSLGEAVAEVLVFVLRLSGRVR